MRISDWSSDVCSSDLGAADELHRHGLFKRMPRGLLDRLAGFADRGLACDHLGDVEPRAVPAPERAERHVGNAGPRRQPARAVDPNGPDLDGREGRPDGPAKWAEVHSKVAALSRAQRLDSEGRGG